jgi:Hypervirulence associated proteins TUDOR domain
MHHCAGVAEGVRMIRITTRPPADLEELTSSVSGHADPSCDDVRRACVARTIMKRTFKVGDHVIWNSEAGRVSGTIVKVHTKDVNYKGYTHHARPDEPQYEIKSDKTDHIAMHKGSALKLRKSHV